MRRKIFTLALILLASFSVCCEPIIEDVPTYASSSIVKEGDAAPDFTAITLSGEEFSLSQAHENTLLLILFSHTCPDCKALFDDIIPRMDEIDSMGAKVIAVSRGGSGEEIMSYMSTNGYQFEAIADSSAEIYGLYATAYVPRTYIINKHGIVEFMTIEYDSSYVTQIIEHIEQMR